MLLILILMTTLIFVLNVKIYRFDFMNPSVVFSGAFLVSELTCLMNVKNYEIEFHIQGILVIISGLLIFSIVSYLIHKYYNIYHEKTNLELSEIKIDDKYIYLLIILQVLTIASFIYYLVTMTAYYNEHYAYEGIVTSFSGMVKLYDTLTKFWTELFSKMNYPIPMIYRVLNPICYGTSMMLVYIIVNNYIVTKKIKIIHIISILLLCVHIYINGSRSPIFRILTMFIILYYILRFKSKKMTSSTKIELKKFYKSIFIILVVFGALMVIMMFAVGREFRANSINEYLFTYIGAPLVNLDNYLVNNIIRAHGTLLGARTFKRIYNYIGKWIEISAFKNIKDINVFAYSNNGIEIGNVYTTYYPWIYDFGYLGILLVIPVAIYFSYMYTRITNGYIKNKYGLSVGLYLYIYLFNDLIMLVFSNRFYGTITDPAFLKNVFFGLVFYYGIQILIPLGKDKLIKRER